MSKFTNSQLQVGYVRHRKLLLQEAKITTQAHVLEHLVPSGGVVLGGCRTFGALLEEVGGMEEVHTVDSSLLLPTLSL